jgi:hypothetical protein
MKTGEGWDEPLFPFLGRLDAIFLPCPICLLNCLSDFLTWPDQGTCTIPISEGKPDWETVEDSEIALSVPGGIFEFFPLWVSVHAVADCPMSRSASA